jgi:hypothetical protein
VTGEDDIARFDSRRYRESSHHSEGGAAELADMTSVPTPEAMVAMLVHKDEQPLGEVTASILMIDEAGQHSVR